MARLEETFIMNSEHNPFFDSICLFLQYIDDCFCIFKDPDFVQDFLQWLNQIHETIFFTMEGDVSQVNFLDTTVYCTNENTLGVRPFVKPTDHNTYLHFKSFHMRHLRTNIPYGQFLRLKRNSAEDKDFPNMLEDFVNNS